MKRFLSILLIAGCASLASAQKSPSKSLFSDRESKKDSLTALKDIKSIHHDKKVALILDKIKVGDTLMYQLDDMAYASAIDSVWMKEFTNDNLYDSIIDMVQDLRYDEVAFAELPTSLLKKRLKDMDAKTPFNIAYNPSLESVIKSYLKRHKPTMERLMGLSEFYFPIFEEALDKYNLPLELKYLAIVESALRPRAQSRVGATGMWQFMYGTAKMYDLEINSYVDERMDPILATEAACQYLETLYGMFGDWDLALAAYNSGPGNVAKAIRRSGGKKNYWNLRPYLPRETAGYVPAFLATMYLFEHANDHGYRPVKPTFNYFQTDTVHIKESITLAQVAKFTGLQLSELQYLNPEFKLDYIPKTSTDAYVLRLPVSSVGKFVYNEKAIYATLAAEREAQQEEAIPQLVDIPKGIVYRVKSGDFLGRIAERYGVGVSQIKRWNNMRSNKVAIGQRLTIHPTKNATARAQTSSSTKTNAIGKKTYVVRNGDSLWTIAKKFPGVSSRNLEVWNDISGKQLRPGMTLIVSN